ncbi:hypothetical protein V6N13_026322 [Hibiscus sabdariffa]
MCKSASRATRSLISASKNSRFCSGGRAVAAAVAVSVDSKLPLLASAYTNGGSTNAFRGWLPGVFALPVAAYMVQEQEAHAAAQNERTFIAIKPDGVQRGLVAEIISRFERKGFKLVAIKITVPSKEFAQKHYHDLKDRPFFNGLCQFLSSGPVVAMVWEGEGVIKYGRKLIGATNPQTSEPGTIRDRRLIFSSSKSMAAKPLTSETIAITEKKMDMTLDDIIKMSKNNSSKGKKQPRIANKSQRPVSNAAKDKAFKVRQYMDSRASLRQGALAQRRSNFQGNGFPFAAEAARRAAVAPFRNRAFNSSRVANLNKPRIGATHFQRRAGNGGFAAKPQQLPQQQQQQQQERNWNTGTKQKPKTLDSLFAVMKEERMRVFSSQQNNNVQANGGGRQRMPWRRGRFGQ